MEAAAAACAKPATGYTYARREPEKTALYQVLQNHLLTFEWRRSGRRAVFRPRRARSTRTVKAKGIRSLVTDDGALARIAGARFPKIVYTKVLRRSQNHFEMTMAPSHPPGMARPATRRPLPVPLSE